MDQPAEDVVLEFRNVTVRFDDEETALDGVTFRLRAGETCVILGAAGSGKTVLLKTAVGLLKADSGQILLFGEDITDREENDLFDLRAKVGMLFQEGGLFDSLTIEENVGYPLVNRRGMHITPEDARPRIEETLHLVELGKTLEKFPAELSGGMRRRVGIARANVTEPPMVLYDSPTAGLDPITAHTIIGLIIKARDTLNTTTLMVTHRYQDGYLLANYRYNRKTERIQPAVADGDGNGHRTRYLVLRDGRLVFEGTQADLEASSDAYLQKFVKKVAS